MNATRSEHNRQKQFLWLVRITGPILILCLLALFSLSFQLQAQSKRNSTKAAVVYVAESENKTLNRRLRELLSDALPHSVEIRSFTPGQSSQDSQSPVIAIGPGAFDRIRKENSDVPLLGLLADDAYARIEQGAAGRNVSAILSDTPLIRQAAIGKSILPYSTRVAMLAKPETEQLYFPVLKQLDSLQMQGRIFVVSSDDRLIPTLVRAINYGDFVLAASDDGIYNPRTIKHILLTAYRRNSIVIGPSQAYVKAGSLASSYTPLSEVAKAAASHIRHYWKHGEFPQASRPEVFGIEINRQVGRSLNIPLPENQVLIDSVIQRLGNSEVQPHD